jgi:hypothetical protein
MPNCRVIPLFTVRSNNQWLLSFEVATVEDHDIRAGVHLRNGKARSRPAAIGRDHDLNSTSSIFDSEVKVAIQELEERNEQANGLT